MKKEYTKDLYERPETEEIEIRIENLCGTIESTEGCPVDSECSENEEF